MLWLYITAGGVGLILGLRFRVPAVVAASAVLLVGAITVGLVAGWSIWTTLAAAFGGAFILQCSYFAGLLLMCAFSRIGSWSDIGGKLIYTYRARAR
jgi:hypothetical protein